MESSPKARFIEPMLLARANPLPEGPKWSFEVKLDGYRTIALKSDGAVRLRSRNGNSGAWQKMRLNQAQEFVIGGYMPAPRYFDALLFGYYEHDRLVYAGRSRSGFTPALRASVWQAAQGLESSLCPFVNLPERHGGRWGEGLTAEKMAFCRWLTPKLVGVFEFVEWTPDHHLRHPRFVALRDDKDARDVHRES